MRIFKKTVCGCLCFFLATSALLSAQEKEPQDLQKSCKTFVQGFYDWYTSKAMKTKGSSTSLALRSTRFAFSPELHLRLNQDTQAQAKSRDGVVGLDFDPFLNAQDQAEHYVAEKVTTKGDNYLVEVYGVWSGKKSEKPDVVPELAFKAGRWTFMNFHYGKDDSAGETDLLGVLKDLREERKKYKD